MRSKLDKILARQSLARKQVSDEKKEAQRIEKKLDALAEAQSLAQVVAQKVQTEAHSQVAQIVTRCLKIFDEPYEFRINFNRKRGRTEAGLIFVRDGVEVDPLSASGGGVVDVAAFALRLACLALSRPRSRHLLLLDEPFRFVSASYRGRIRILLEGLARDLGIQIVMISHDPALHSGALLSLD